MKQIFSFVVILILFLACSKPPGELNLPSQIQDSLMLVVTKNNIPSDNYSYAEISAVIEGNQALSNQIIIFSADRGLFSNDSSIYITNVSINDTAKAYIKYNKAEIVRISASISNANTKEAFVTFFPSYPDQILIAPDISVLTDSFGSNTIINTKLVRLNGTVNTGFVIHYYDSTATNPGRSVGTCLNSSLSDSIGNATTQYSLQDTSYHGFVYIKSYVDTDTGRVSGLNRIYVQ